MVMVPIPYVVHYMSNNDPFGIQHFIPHIGAVYNVWDDHSCTLCSAVYVQNKTFRASAYIHSTLVHYLGNDFYTLASALSVNLGYSCISTPHRVWHNYFYTR